MKWRQGAMAVKRIKDMDENQEQALIVSWCLQNDLIPVAVPNGFNLGGSIQWAAYQPN